MFVAEAASRQSPSNSTKPLKHVEKSVSRAVLWTLTARRQDLLVRVRYLNPIPPPPFPPKLFDVPTNVHRLGEPSYLDHLASTAPFPMLVDSEMGMPLNLNNYDKIWEGKDECESSLVLIDCAF